MKTIRLFSTCFPECGLRICDPHLLTLFVLLPAMVIPAHCTAEDAAEKAVAKMPTGISASITDQEVQDRLQLSEDQREKIAALDAVRNTELAQLRETPPKDNRSSFAQMREVTNRFDEGARELLSAEQRKEWSRLKSLHGVSLIFSVQRILGDEVRKELQLTNEQVVAIDGLQREFYRECERIADQIEDTDAAVTTEWWDQPLMKKARDIASAFESRLDSLIDKTLMPAQQFRWSQILWQRAAADRGPALLLEDSVIKYLALSDKQRSEIDEIAKATDRDANAEREQHHWGEAMRIPSANLKKALVILTRIQRHRWDQMLGRPFRERFLQWQTGELGTKKSEQPQSEGPAAGPRIPKE